MDNVDGEGRSVIVKGMASSLRAESAMHSSTPVTLRVNKNKRTET